MSVITSSAKSFPPWPTASSAKTLDWHTPSPVGSGCSSAGHAYRTYFKMAAKFSRFHENRSYEVAEPGLFNEPIYCRTLRMINDLMLWKFFCYEFPFLCPSRPEVLTFLILMMMNRPWRKRPWKPTLLR